MGGGVGVIKRVHGRAEKNTFLLNIVQENNLFSRNYFTPQGGVLQATIKG